MGKEILSSNRSQIMEQAKLIYSPLGKALEKQTKTIEDEGERQKKMKNLIHLLKIIDIMLKKMKGNLKYLNQAKKLVIIL